MRLAIGSTPRRLLFKVVCEGATIVAAGLLAGLGGGYVFATFASSYFETLELPGVPALMGAAGVLVGAAVIASMMPALRASRVDVLQALRSE